MGIDTNRFVCSVPDSLLCSICNDVLDQPVQCLKYQHLFCLDCITSWLQVNSSCPLDREELLVSQLKPVHHVIGLLDNYDVRCEFSGFGCQAVDKYGLVKEHEDNCEFSNVLVVAIENCLINKYKYDAATLHMHLENAEHNLEQLSLSSKQINCKLQKKDDEIRNIHIRLDISQQKMGKLEEKLRYRQDEVRKLEMHLEHTLRREDKSSRHLNELNEKSRDTIKKLKEQVSRDEVTLIKINSQLSSFRKNVAERESQLEQLHRKHLEAESDYSRQINGLKELKIELEVEKERRSAIKRRH